MIDFRALFKTVSKRHRMYVFDDRYLTLVAFVNGCDVATGSKVLAGFHDWVAEQLYQQRQTSLSWAALIAGRRAPGCLTGEETLGELPREFDAILREDLFDLLDEFLSVAGPSAVQS
jgi:hypothetical protein